MFNYFLVGILICANTGGVIIYSSVRKQNLPAQIG